MGYINEPDGIDFVINGKPLTEKKSPSANLLKQTKKKSQSERLAEKVMVHDQKS